MKIYGFLVSGLVFVLCCFYNGSVVAASTIFVETTAMEVTDGNPFGNDNGLCALDEAFVIFGGYPANDCEPQVNGDISPLVIELQAVVYSLTSGLILSDSSQGDVIELRGNGATIERADAATDDFRLLRAYTGWPDSKLLISDLTFRNAETTEPGAALDVRGFNLDLDHVTFKDNHSAGSEVGTGQGGALLVSSSAGNELHINMQHCRFEGNKADRIAGAVYLGGVSGSIADTIFVDNQSGAAGALYSSGNNLTIANSKFIGNHAIQQGGAIQATGQADSPDPNGVNGLNISASIFRGNTSDLYSGAIQSTANPTIIRNSLFQGNTADKGGALTRGLPYASEYSIYNSTFTENTATNGGAIAIDHGKMSLQSVTIVGNDSSSQGGGIWVAGTATASVSVDHSIIHSNSARSGPNDCWGTTRSGGDYSIIAYCDLPLAANEVSRAGVLLTDILLPLANNGGGTKTFEPVEGGIAHNRGNRAYLSDTGFDQRGFPRIAEGRVDIGAHERSAEKVVGMFDVIFNQSMESNEPLRFFDRDAFLDKTGAYDATGPLPALGNQKDNPNPIDVGSVTFVRYTSGTFNFSQWSDQIPGLPDTGDTVDLALNALEEFDVQTNYGVMAFGFDFVDPSGDSSKFQMQACASTFNPASENCPQNDIVFAMDFSSDNTERRFFGFMVNKIFRQVSIRELSNSGSNEYWGHFYTTPEP